MDFAALDKKLAYYQEHKHLIPEEVKQNYEDVFAIEYTHNSTAIEGNTLSLAETKLILEDGISPNGKNMREVFEVHNHGKAYSYSLRCITEGKALDKNIVKDIHATSGRSVPSTGLFLLRHGRKP